MKQSITEMAFEMADAFRRWGTGGEKDVLVRLAELPPLTAAAVAAYMTHYLLVCSDRYTIEDDSAQTRFLRSLEAMAGRES